MEVGHGGNRRLLGLLDHLHAIDEATSARELAETTAAAAAAMAGVPAVGVIVVEPERRHAELVAALGGYRRLREGARLPLDGTEPPLRALAEGKSMETPEGLSVPGAAGGESLLAIDVVFDADADEGSGGTDAWCSEAEPLLRALALHAAVALRSQRGRDQLLAETRRLEAVLECSADAIITTDPKGCVSFFSPGAVELFGFAAEDVVGRPVSDYYVGGEPEARRVQRWLEEEGKVRNYEAWFRTAAGEPLPASLSASVLRDRQGRVLGTLGILKDITVEKRLERKLSYTIEMLQEANENLGRLAVTDSLSGLKNQRFFHRKLEEEMLRAQRTGRPLSLLLIDIDKFKRFNDEHGHQVGDRVIAVMGETILQSIRKIDHGCRYGGEEFTVVLPETSADNGAVVARRIQKTFATHDAWGELRLEPPTLSIGLACVAEKKRGGEADTDALVREADEAMYRAKRRGGNDIEIAVS